MGSAVVLKQLRVSNLLTRFHSAVTTTDVFGGLSSPVRRMYHGRNRISFSRAKYFIKAFTFQREEADRFYLFVEMPGIPKENVEVFLKHDLFMFIRGSVLKDYLCETKKYETQFRVEENIKWSGIKADMRNGLLRLTLPKRQETEPQEEIPCTINFNVD